MQHEGAVENVKEREAKGLDDKERRRIVWADWEMRSDLAAVGLKFWTLDWELLERYPPKVGNSYGAEREEIARQEGRLGSAC